MSLINDMLRDLEGRRRSEQAGMKFTEIPIAVKAGSGLRRWLLLGVIALALAAVAWLGTTFFILSPSSSSERTEQQEASLPTGSSSVPEPEAFEKARPAPAEERSVDSGSVETTERPAPTTEPKASVLSLLDLQVHELEKKTRLVLDFSGLPQYQLQQSGRGNSQLILGFNNTHLGKDFKLSEREGGLIGQISLQPQERRLQLLIGLTRKAEVLGYELKVLERAGYRLQVDLVADAEPADIVAQKPKRQEEPVAEKVVTSGMKTVEQTKEVKPAVEPARDAPLLSKSSKKLSPDQQAYRQGINEMRQDLLEKAEKSFSLALRLNPGLLEARLQLIRILESRGRDMQAGKLMEQGLEISPNNRVLRKKYARLLLTEKRLQEAISLLQKSPVPAVAEDVEYHALLAALQQENRQYEAAAENYMRLLQVRPQEAVWWMGLAVSRDQDGDFLQARKAYQQALALPGLSSDLQEYIEGRLRVL